MANMINVRITRALKAVIVAGTTAVAGMAAIPAQAQDSTWQFELGLSQLADDNFDTEGVMMRLGHEWGTYGQFGGLVDALALEVEGYYGVVGDETETETGLTEARIEHSGSANVRAIKNIGTQFDLFVRAGVSHATPEFVGATADAPTVNADKDTGLLLGGGAVLRLNWNTGLRADYTVQNDYESFSVGLRWEF